MDNSRLENSIRNAGLLPCYTDRYITGTRAVTSRSSESESASSAAHNEVGAKRLVASVRSFLSVGLDFKFAPASVV